MKNPSEVFEQSVKGVQDYIKKSGLKSMILGVSGGIDSSVCAAICWEVKRRNPGIEFIGVSLPAFTNGNKEVSTAQKIGAAFFKPSKFWERNIQPEFETLKTLCSEHFVSEALQDGNIKARIRMIYLRDLASKRQGVVISTGNMTEDQLGFFTVAGDVGDLSPIADLWKHEVYELTQWIIDNKCETQGQKEALTLSAGLIPTDGNGVKEGGDLAQIAPTLKSYSEVDDILMTYLRYKKKPSEDNLFFLQTLKDKYGEEAVSMVIERHKKSEFKRLPSPIRVPLSPERDEPSREDIQKRTAR